MARVNPYVPRPRGPKAYCVVDGKSMAPKPRTDGSEMIPVRVSVNRTTDKAVLVQFPKTIFSWAELWVPRSVILQGDQVTVPAEGLTVKRWFAGKNGLPIIGRAETKESPNG